LPWVQSVPSVDEAGKRGKYIEIPVQSSGGGAVSPYASGLFKKAWGRLRGYGWLFELPLMLGCAALAGVAAALTTQLFYEGIYLVQHLVAGRSGSISATMQSLPWYGRLLL